MMHIKNFSLDYDSLTETVEFNSFFNSIEDAVKFVNYVKDFYSPATIKNDVSYEDTEILKDGKVTITQFKDGRKVALDARLYEDIDELVHDINMYTQYLDVNVIGLKD
jgi:hypothetical protein